MMRSIKFIIFLNHVSSFPFIIRRIYHQRRRNHNNAPPLLLQEAPAGNSASLLQQLPQQAFDPLVQAIQDAAAVAGEGGDDAQRIFHGRGGMYKGICEQLTLDWFPPVWFLTSHKVKLSNETLTSIQDALEASLQESDVNFVYQHRNATSSDTRVISGMVPKPHVITENGMKFLISLLSGNKNHGLFLDMANGRKWVREHTNQQKVLNLFAYTCGFSVAALMGGASEVINVDMATGPMNNGKRNHELNNLTSSGARFLTHNIFKTWGKIRKLGELLKRSILQIYFYCSDGGDSLGTNSGLLQFVCSLSPHVPRSL